MSEGVAQYPSFVKVFEVEEGKTVSIQWRKKNGLTHERWFTENDHDLRDYFAAHALEILLKHGTEAFPKFSDVAVECYRFADAMLKARSPQQP